MHCKDLDQQGERIDILLYALVTVQWALLWAQANLLHAMQEQ